LISDLSFEDLLAANKSYILTLHIQNLSFASALHTSPGPSVVAKMTLMYNYLPIQLQAEDDHPEEQPTDVGKSYSVLFTLDSQLSVQKL
jgi:hypothetical protein